MLFKPCETPYTLLLQDLKFGIGDGKLHYYLYNWRVANELPAGEVGLVML